MTFAQRAPITAFRNDPLRVTLEIELDLTGATVAFAVRQHPDQSGAALLSVSGSTLAVNASPAPAPSIRLVDVDTDDDGVTTSVIELRDTKAHMQALPAAAVQGDDLSLYYDLQFTLATGVAAPFAAEEETVLFGDFIVKGSANG